MADAAQGECTPEEDPVLLEVGADGVAVVVLNRPHRRNGWNPDMERRYFQVLEQADRDPLVRVLIVTGAGTTFCPGVDSGRLERIAGQRLDVSDRGSPIAPWRVRKPMIAAVNGACAGMGLMQALLCDVRFAARGARRVLTCVLLEKPGKRAVSLNADFVGFTCPDLFVVGYGMDVAHAYRQLPFVGVVEKD